MRQKQELYEGNQVEMFDGSHKGTIKQVVNPEYLIILWDDGEIGHVHPLDVNHLSEVRNGI